MEIYAEILEKAKLLMRKELSESEEGVLYEMCLSAYSELLGRLKDGISTEDIREQFVRAAGALALSMYVGIDASQLDGYTAGGLSVRRRSARTSRDAALSLRRQAELMLTGYLKERNFNFLAVRG